MKQVEIENLDLTGERVKTKNEIPTEIADLTDGQQTLNAISQNTQDIDNIENTLPNLASQSYVDQKFNGAAKAISFDSYATMITAFNALADDVYVSGQNINILTLEVPDLWVYEVDSTRIPYTYVDDATFVNELSTNGYVQVGFYKLAALETQKVDLTNYQEKLTTTSVSSGTIDESIGFDNLGNVVRGSVGGGQRYLHNIKLERLSSQSATQYRIFIKIINNSNTPITNYVDITSYLNSLPTDDKECYEVRGYFSGDTTANKYCNVYYIGYFSENQIYLYVLRNDTNTITQITSSINLATIKDTVTPL